MNTTHSIIINKAQKMHQINDNSVDLVVTSPPYPMIEMWDDIMSAQNPQIKDAFDNSNPKAAFELMHKELDEVWNECFRVIKEGGFLCINIGDATRTLNGDFALYNNHSRITSHCLSLGFENLPNVIWRKPTNAPNKFMGSGMLPCGAYVTLEHEYILVFRKGSKRQYKSEESKASRRQSSFFWEERNIWFSDVWDLKGTRQKIDKSLTRERSAAFPLEIPYRIINMYSQRGDLVLDPFMGIGTTTQAAILTGRNSIGYEIDQSLSAVIENNIAEIDIASMNSVIKARYDKHLSFIQERTSTHGEPKYHNNYLNCGIMTAQELDMELHYLTTIKKTSAAPLSFEVQYEDHSDMNNPPIPEGFLL